MRCARIVVIASLVVVASTAGAQERKADIAKDAIFARKILMDSINNNMDEIEGMISSGKPLDLAEAHEHADVISVMLMAFPHLFPPSTNQWRPNVERDPCRDTFAAPELWTRFDEFYALAAAASKIAYGVSRAADEVQFKEGLIQLRTTCDSCHAAYLKTGQ